ncbi:MAG: hypothetical protein ACUZ8I_08085 [Candidatus Scalindua sp.]
MRDTIENDFTSVSGSVIPDVSLRYNNIVNNARETKSCHGQRKGPDVKAIVTSGYSDDPIIADFSKYGFSGVLAKPYEIDELYEAIQNVGEM